MSSISTSTEAAEAAAILPRDLDAMQLDDDDHHDTGGTDGSTWVARDGNDNHHNDAKEGEEEEVAEHVKAKLSEEIAHHATFLMNGQASVESKEFLEHTAALCDVTKRDNGDIPDNELAFICDQMIRTGAAAQFVRILRDADSVPFKALFYALWTVCNISSGPNRCAEHMRKDLGVLPLLVKLTEHKATIDIVETAVWTLGNICGIGREAFAAGVASGIMPAFARVFHRDDFKKHASLRQMWMWAFQNCIRAARETSDAKEAAAAGDEFRPYWDLVVDRLTHETDDEVLLDAAWTVHNFAASIVDRDKGDVDRMVACVPPLMKRIGDEKTNRAVCIVALRALSQITGNKGDECVKTVLACDAPRVFKLVWQRDIVKFRKSHVCVAVCDVAINIAGDKSTKFDFLEQLAQHDMLKPIVDFAVETKSMSAATCVANLWNVSIAFNEAPLHMLQLGAARAMATAVEWAHAVVLRAVAQDEGDDGDDDEGRKSRSCSRIACAKTFVSALKASGRQSSTTISTTPPTSTNSLRMGSRTSGRCWPTLPRASTRGCRAKLSGTRPSCWRV